MIAEMTQDNFYNCDLNYYQIGPDTTKNMIHYVYPHGKSLTPEQLDPNVGGWFGKCKHIYEYVNAPKCPYCGKDTHEPNWEEQRKLRKEWLKKNPNAWRQVGWWSI